MNAYVHVLPKGNGTYIQCTCTWSNLTHECVNELTLWIRRMSSPALTYKENDTLLVTVGFELGSGVFPR